MTTEKEEKVAKNTDISANTLCEKCASPKDNQCTNGLCYKCCSI